MLEVMSLGFEQRQQNLTTTNTTSLMVKRNGTTFHFTLKRRITNALWADYVTAAVRTGKPGNQASGISVLVIPLTVPGITRRRIYNSGVAASGSTFIEFDNVKVPVSNLLGKENQGFQIIMSSR
jgi:alkylation response protein AidB-like acyl-CoA dehydrogenase